MEERNDDISLSYLAFIKDSIPVLELDFRVKGREYHSAMLTGVASAVSIYLSEFTEGEVKVIDQGNIKIGFEEGTICSVIYMTNTINTTLQKKIILMLKTFEVRFNEYLIADLIDHNEFSQFTDYIIETFAEELIKDYYVPYFVERSFRNDNLPDLAIPDEAWEILTYIDGNNTVTMLLERINEPKEDIIEMLALLRAQKLIDFLIYLSPEDIPMITTIGTHLFFKDSIHFEGLTSMFGEEVLSIIKNIDGIMPISHIITEKYSSELLSDEINDLLKYLLWKGYIQIIASEYKYCSIIEYFYNLTLSLATEKLGWDSETFFSKLESFDNPLIELILLKYDRLSFDRVRAYCRRSVDNYEIIVKKLLTPIEGIYDQINNAEDDDHKKSSLNHLSKIFGKKVTDLIEKNC
jgi:hypothetical protein